MHEWAVPEFLEQAVKELFEERRHKLTLDKEKIIRYGLLDTIDSRHFYPTLETAVAAFYEEWEMEIEGSE